MPNDIKHGAKHNVEISLHTCLCSPGPPKPPGSLIADPMFGSNKKKALHKCKLTIALYDMFVCHIHFSFFCHYVA